MACLPEYGTNNAAIVLNNLVRSFPSIRLGLMVGIGGGAPSKITDIRLGDIVVGTRVMQYDLGNIVSEGPVKRTAIPKIPAQSLGTAVSSLRSNHELKESPIQAIFRERMKDYPDYQHPGIPDRLFKAELEHTSDVADCRDCDASHLVMRSRRTRHDPLVHYGVIASGNQVMRNGNIRDAIAKELGALCFEMEAAGLMDILPCLPIRGICDYSDTHKNKEWQRYAAAMAASYARELLEFVPTTVPQPLRGKSFSTHMTSPSHRQAILNTLKFDQLDARKANIRKAHPRTCQWFLDHSDYKSWLDPSKLAKHHGFLWINGKAGAGKSTVMKFLYTEMTKMSNREDYLVTSFFFNARGEFLERSVGGMYRTLLLHLLEGYPDIQTILDNSEVQFQSEKKWPSLNFLIELLAHAISALGRRSVTFFIDALDEGDEQEVRDMVQHFEDLAELSVAEGTQLRICLSSRPYPYVSMRRGIRLTLEEMSGHADDITIYVKNRLRAASLVQLLIDRAGGIFLWAVLAVSIINEEYRNGGLALRKRLEEIPKDLSGLFRGILTRDSKNMERLLLGILWVLLARQPLRPEEYYHALWAGLLPMNLVDEELPGISNPYTPTRRTNENLASFVITSSKGLAEITKAEHPRVQFIHESVRDFLINEKGLQEVWPDLELDWQLRGHDRLKLCCSSYINNPDVQARMELAIQTASNRHLPTLLDQVLPFLRYASINILRHANTAADAVDQRGFLSELDIPVWVKTANNCHQDSTFPYTAEATLVYILASGGHANLIRSLKPDRFHCRTEEHFRYPLFAALWHHHNEAMAALLNQSSPKHLMEVVKYNDIGGNDKDGTPLIFAVRTRMYELVRLLLQQGALPNEKDSSGELPLTIAASTGNLLIVRLLLQQGALVNERNSLRQLPLTLVFNKIRKISHRDFDGRFDIDNHFDIAQLLLEQGSLVDEGSYVMGSLLLAAAKYGRTELAQLLIQRGAQLDGKEPQSPVVVSGRTALIWAVVKRRTELLQLLLQHGAPIDQGDSWRRTPLNWAVRLSHVEHVRILLQHGASINEKDGSGMTPLSLAMESLQSELVELLLTSPPRMTVSGKQLQYESSA